MSETSHTSKRFSQWAWFVVGYLLLVILWGAWVRITHSGAGCGNHWPTCHGELIPHIPGKKTMIEYIHRITSGLSLPLVLGMLIAAWKKFPKGHLVRTAYVGTLIFLLSESALGAGLVKFDLVANNTSVARAITASLHLVNTFALTAFAALAARWSQGHRHLQWNFKERFSRFLLPALLAVVISSMAGAVTALGDTLFPIKLGEVFHHTASTHFLVQLRILHPILAVLTGVYLLIILPILQESHPELKLLKAAQHAVMTQLALGGLNIFLGAPGWMQIIHLLMALIVTLLVLFCWIHSQETASDSSIPNSQA